MNKLEEELKKELRESGATDEELIDLLKISSKLQSFSGFKTSKDYKKKNLRRIVQEPLAGGRVNIFYKWAITPLIALVVLFFGFNTIVGAQKSQPGESLYPVKRVSEDVFRKVDPEFNNEIIIRRSEEAKKLVEEKKDSLLLKKTLNEYKKEILKEEKKNDKKFEESKKNIEEIKEKIEEKEKKEIEDIFRNIEEKKEASLEKKEEKKIEKQKE